MRRRQRQRHREYTVEWIQIEDVEPYEFNPRDNAQAIQAVANSIEEFGWMVPCVIDSDNILVAGHTRIEAAKLLGDDEILCYRAEHLSPEQIKAFRLIDNKVAELATWDNNLLANELAGLSDLLDFTDFGWTQEAIDCLGETVADDCLSGGDMDDVTRGDAATRTNDGAGPQRTRIICGEFVFYVQIAAYQLWAREVKEANDFVDTEIISDLKERLGITEHE